VYQVDSKSGEVLRIFRGADKESIGGVLSASNGQMISVSNLAVTAYQVSGDSGKASR
jgi:hypothetical protein